jgi:glucosylceramidase
VYDQYPDMILLPTEATYEMTVLDDDDANDNWLADGIWSKGEGYAFDIMGDLNAGSGGWTDWNILLDQNGGPNHVGNYCDAAIIGDVSEEGSEAIYFHPQYYYLGHFSKFLPPGSTRISVEGGVSTDDCTWPYGRCDEDTLQSTAFEVENGDIAFIVMNCGADDKSMDLNVVGLEGILQNKVPANSIQTYIIPGAVSSIK